MPLLNYSRKVGVTINLTCGSVVNYTIPFDAEDLMDIALSKSIHSSIINLHNNSAFYIHRKTRRTKVIMLLIYRNSNKTDAVKQAIYQQSTVIRDRGLMTNQTCLSMKFVFTLKTKNNQQSQLHQRNSNFINLQYFMHLRYLLDSDICIHNDVINS